MNKRAPIYFINFVSLALMALLPACMKPGEFLTGKEITNFVFKEANNDDVLTKDEVGEISETTIDVDATYYTDKQSLIASFDVSEGATVKVDDVVQESGKTRNNFSGEVIYTVIAQDGTSQDYKVNVAFSVSSEKEMLSFAFEKAKNSTALSEDVEGDISKPTIFVLFPSGTNAENLKASFDVSKGATVKVGGQDQESGITVNDFNNGDVTYKVIAKDGSSEQDYTVTVRTAPSMSVSSYYLSSDRIGAGDLEKPDLFEISDIVNGEHDYSLKIGGLDAVTGKLTATEEKATLGGGVLSTSDWKSIGDGAISIILTIGINNNEFTYSTTYSTTKEQYSIRSWQDLQGMKYNSNGSYTLMNNIEMPSPSTTGGTFPAELPSQGFKPVGKGTGNDSFKGSFNGQDHVISNFFINRVDTDYVGLFGSTKGTTTTIKDVDIEISSGGVTGRYYVGGLVGRALEGSTIKNCNVTEDDNVTENDDIVTGKRNIGGLVGSATNTTITNSYTMIKVNSTGGSGGDSDVGGLVGSTTNSSITNSYATGAVTGDRTVGGLVGDADSNTAINNTSTTIANSYATGKVEGSAIVGGLVGVLGANNKGSYIYGSYATGIVSGTTAEESYVGGLVGRFFRGTISDSYATGSVSGVKYVGGLFGRIHHTDAFTKRTYATGRVTGSSDVGGLGGHQSGGGDTHSYWDITSTGQTQSSVGTGVSSRSNLVEIEGKYYDTGPNPDVEVFIDWKFGNNDENPWKWEGIGQWPTLYWQ